jgi:hypothetical protein
MNRNAGNIASNQFTFASMEPGTDLDSKRPQFSAVIA